MVWINEGGEKGLNSMYFESKAAGFSDGLNVRWEGEARGITPPCLA